MEIKNYAHCVMFDSFKLQVIKNLSVIESQFRMSNITQNQIKTQAVTINTKLSAQIYWVQTNMDTNLKAQIDQVRQHMDEQFDTLGGHLQEMLWLYATR